MPGTAPHLQGRVQGQRATPCFQQRCVLCTATAKPYAGPWLSSRFHPQHKNVLELAAKADLAAVALRLAWGAEFCQGAARLREEMTFYESKFHFCVELCPGRLRLSQIGPIILPTSLTCCTSPTWFLAAPTPMGACGQAVPCASAEQLMCSGDARQKAGVLCVPTSAHPAAAPRTLWGSAQGGPRECWCHRELVLFAELTCVFVSGKCWAGTGAGLSTLLAQGTGHCAGGC